MLDARSIPKHIVANTADFLTRDDSVTAGYSIDNTIVSPYGKVMRGHPSFITENIPFSRIGFKLENFIASGMENKNTHFITNINTNKIRKSWHTRDKFSIPVYVPYITVDINNIPIMYYK